MKVTPLPSHLHTPNQLQHPIALSTHHSPSAATLTPVGD